MQMISPDKTRRGELQIDNKPFLSAEPLELDFGQVYLGQVCCLPIRVRSSNFAGTKLSSSLYSIVYFKDGQ